jgi:hypothetical protein
LRELTSLVQGKAEIIVRLGEIRSQSQGFAIGRSCRRELPERAQRLTKIVVIFRYPRVDVDRSLNLGDSVFVLAPLVRHHPQQVQRLGVLRLRLQDATVDRLRLFEPPSSMQLQGTVDVTHERVYG